MVAEALFSGLPATITGFVFGLAAKLLYDLWQERRRRKRIILRKINRGSFSVDQLDEKIRERVRVLLGDEEIESIRLVRLEVENNGAAAVKGQSISVVFDGNARIIGKPNPVGSSEDLRHVVYDLNTLNSQRFIINLLQRNRRLAWDFTVANSVGEFDVEHGVALEELQAPGDASLDVSSTVTESPGDSSLEGSLKEIILLLVCVAALQLLKEPLSTLPGGAKFLLPLSLMMILIYLILLRLFQGLIGPLLVYLRLPRQPQIQIGGAHALGDIVIASEIGALSRGQHDRNDDNSSQEEDLSSSSTAAGQDGVK